MKKALLVLGILFVLSSTGSAGTYNQVTNCSSEASTFGSLPYAVVSAEANGWPIKFNIPTSESYADGSGWISNEATGAQWFRILVKGTLNISTSGIIIDGFSQPTTESYNPYGPQIELRNSGANHYGISIQSSNCTIEGLTLP